MAKKLKARFKVKAAAPAQDAFEHEIKHWASNAIYEAIVKVDEQMLNMQDKGKWPEKRMEYGIMRYQPNNMMADKFLEEVVDAYASWSGNIKKMLKQ